MAQEIQPAVAQVRQQAVGQAQYRELEVEYIYFCLLGFFFVLSFLFILFVTEELILAVLLYFWVLAVFLWVTIYC